jgi:hypothetical protein
MIRPLNRARNVLALADEIRERHQLGDTPVRWRQLRTMLAAERIRIRAIPMRPRAYVTGTDGNYVIAIRETIDQRQAVKLVLHEFAHVKLGHLGDVEVERQLFPCLKDDPREHEANLLAALLWHGPEATPDHTAIARLVAKLEAGEYRRKMPAQIPLELPELPPVYGADTFALHEEWEKASRPNPRLRQLPDTKRVKLAGARDPFTARFVDRDGRLWYIYDRPSVRGFYISPALRRIYRFRPGEIRALKAKHLDRQLLEARAIRPAVAPSRAQHEAIWP